VRYNLGNALLKAGKLEGAIEQYEQALRIKPDYAEVDNNIALHWCDWARCKRR